MKRKQYNKENVGNAFYGVYQKRTTREMLRKIAFSLFLSLNVLLLCAQEAMTVAGKNIEPVVITIDVNRSQNGAEAAESATGMFTISEPAEKKIRTINDMSHLPGIEYFPRFAVKTNLLYGATGTPNIGFEFLLNKYLTLDISGGWNPFRYSNDKKFAHWMVQPTLRYWIQEPFNGHFIGASLMYSNFNVSQINLPFNILPALNNHRFRGDAYAVSFQYGYQWMLSPRWGIETTFNVGYMYLDYRKFDCGHCGQLLGRETKHYLGPTNASVSLIYMIR